MTVTDAKVVTIQTLDIDTEKPNGMIVNTATRHDSRSASSQSAMELLNIILICDIQLFNCIVIQY